jgi:hypothetical protein
MTQSLLALPAGAVHLGVDFWRGTGVGRSFHLLLDSTTL